MGAQGNPVKVADSGPMTDTVMALNPVLGELTFLPAPPRA